jgi:hypothetical protein
MAGSGTDDIDVINNALSRIGAGPLFSLTEETDLAAQCNAIYRPVVNALIGRYAFSFASRTYRLDAVAATAENGYDAAGKCFATGWRYGFFLPGTRLSLPHRILDNPRAPNRPLRDYLIEEDKVFADRTPLWATVPVWTAIANWLPTFRLAAETLLAGHLAVPITHDKGFAADLIELAQGAPRDNGIGGLVGQAITLDAASSRSAAPMQSDPLGDARFA